MLISRAIVANEKFLLLNAYLFHLLLDFSFNMKVTRITFFSLLILIFDVFKNERSNLQNGLL